MRVRWKLVKERANGEGIHRNLPGNMPPEVLEPVFPDQAQNETEQRKAVFTQSIYWQANGMIERASITIRSTRRTRKDYEQRQLSNIIGESFRVMPTGDNEEVVPVAKDGETEPIRVAGREVEQFDSLRSIRAIM